MTLLFALLLALLIGFFALRIWAHTAPQPELGAEHGKLAPCPESPNCVSSEASDEEHAIAPLELPVGGAATGATGDGGATTGDGGAVGGAVGDGGAGKDPTSVAIEALKAVVAEMPRSRVVVERENYLAAEFRSKIFGFIDDVEFRVDADAGVVHFRSASRLGYSDMGANRERMEAIRRLWSQRVSK
jgi:uncharacterized protein (DUF1499 family)